MSVKMRNFTRFSLALAALLLLAVTLSTCESTLGFGEAIDWEPPELWFEPEPSNPVYVKQGAVISGIATDNIGVDRIIARNADTGEPLDLFELTVSGDDPRRKEWSIVMNFEEADNDKKIPIEIVAYDKRGNTGEDSMVSVTIVVDIGPPIVEDIWILRTSLKTANLEQYQTLYALETSDTLGEISENMNKYQNGFFTIAGKTAEAETRIQIISLNIYDKRDPNTPLLELNRDEDSDEFSPRWSISEEALLDAGEALWPGYKNDYYTTNTRYYYRVVIVAYDRSENESEYDPNILDEDLTFEEQGFFVMWETADVPKGLVDRKAVPINAIQKGGSVPVVFFDDDQLLWAYTGLLTKEQWNGEADLNPDGLRIDSSKSNDEKLVWLRDELQKETVINNWRQDRYADETQTENRIIEQIKGKKLDEHIVYVQTGNNVNDNGEYVLFSLVADEKLAPHTNEGPRDTDRPREKLRHYPIEVIDENEPLIVFDTTATGTSGHFGGAEMEPFVGARTGDSPEENTFPQLTNGEKFTINGYTLRANKVGQNNRVIAFRMAWIPSGMITSGMEGAIIKQVQTALQDDNYLALGVNSSMYDFRNQGVKDWDFIPRDPDPEHLEYTYEDYFIEGKSPLLTGTSQTLGESTEDFYKKQVFRNEFNILTDFIYNGVLENKTKLFVFYAEDDMGHVVFRQLRLLGNHTPPDLAVYDISGRIIDTDMPSGIPDVSVIPYLGNAEHPQYISDLKTYNEGNNVYDLLLQSTLSPALTNDDKTIPYQIYTRDTILKYWVTANKSGDLNIKSITMKDITVADEDAAVVVRSVDSNKALTYVEFFPDETQRVFLFTAEDTLGNVAKIQRTIAISNMARLESITTTRGNGTYGIDNDIILKANFSGQVSIEGTPELNVRYTLNGTNYIQSIACEPFAAGTTSALSLEFKFTVPEGASGQLLTMYDGGDLGGVAGPEANPVHTDRPIRLLNNARIIDVIRDTDAFVPGYMTGSASMPKWTTNKGSLQQGKNIYLDGSRPSITSVAVSGKTAHSPNNYYFKSDETITLTLTANVPIRPSTIPPVLQYYIAENVNETVQGPFTTAFTYARSGPANTNSLIFSLPVNITNTPYDGELVQVSLLTGTGAGTIENNVGNSVTSASSGALLSLAPNGTRIFIKKSVPMEPISTLTGATTTITFPPANAEQLYNARPQLSIANSSATLRAWEETKQYSLNGGLSWSTYGSAVQIEYGTHQLRTRYVDRAGNEGEQAQQNIQVNNTFPKLIAVTSVQPNGWHRSGPLSFVLNFEDQVRAVNAGDTISITLKNRNETNNNDNPDTPTTTSAVKIIAAGPTALASTITVRFTISGNEMRDGLYVSTVDFSKLQDKFGNPGGTWTGTWSGTAGTATAPTITVNNSTGNNNLSEGLKVDAIAPSVSIYSPDNNGVSSYPTSGTDRRNIITLTFNEPVQKGSGVITIQPKSDFLIPPVFEDTGYYLDCVDEVTTSVSSNRTIWIPGFYDIYNSLSNAADKNALTQSATEPSQRKAASAGVTPSDELDTGNPSMTRLLLNNRTGQPEGPYVKTTHGLKEGYGYSGNYSGNIGAAEVQGPHTESGYTSNVGGTNPFTAMVPDTSTKWVLKYSESINGTGTAITNIRKALQAAKFRWQEIEVGWDNVTIGTPAPNGQTVVSIRLSEPLLQGLQWDLSYLAGTFTDEAGNPAAGQAVNSYTFWSQGARKPVIRVDRKSYDARTSAWHAPRTDANNSTSFTYSEPTGDWGIDAFNTINYRIESETPDATINYTVTGRSNSIGGTAAGTFNAVIIPNTTSPLAASNDNGIGGTIWSGNIPATSPGNYTTTNWETPEPGTGNRNSFWVRPNLLRKFGRSGDYAVRSAQLVNGDQRRSSGSLSVLHSYNADSTLTTLSGLGLTTGTPNQNWYTGAITFDPLEAGKSYVVATAQRGTGSPSAKGYEGVFRTLVVLNGQRGNRSFTGGNSTNAGINKILVGGSNVKSGTPSIPGFPLLDGAENGDARFVKMMYNVDNHANGTNTGVRFYWVSTEIVCEFYLVYFGNGGDIQRTGDVNNYLMVRYGDLSYAYRLDRFPDTP